MFLPKPHWDDELGGQARPCFLAPGHHHLHCRGRRLWATRLAPELGFRGRLHWVHKTNIPELFGLSPVVNEAAEKAELLAYRWYPSRLELEWRAGPLRVLETKFITAGDSAVAFLQLTNTTARRASIAWLVSSELLACPGGRLHLPVEGERRLWGDDVVIRLAGAGVGLQPAGPTIVAGGETACAWLAISLRVRGEAADEAVLGVETQGEAGRFLLDRHLAAQVEWEAGIPAFACDKAELNRMWHYRWLVTRCNLAQPGLGCLPQPLYYEGRAHKGSDEPWHTDQGGFARLIPFSTPCHLLDGRWHADPAPVFGEVWNAVHAPGEGGRLTTVQVDGALPRGFYNHYIAWAAWQAYLVHRDREWLAAVAPGLADDLQAWLSEGLLPVMYDHNKTGMEYQPSFWYFTGYPQPPEEAGAKPIGLTTFTPLRRVDTAVYAYLNAAGLAAIYAELGQPAAAAAYAGTARQIGQAILRQMWDPASAFFYDLHYETYERAPVKNITGYLPFLTGLCRRHHAGAWQYLQEDGPFATPFAFPSTDRGNTMYAPDASVAGVHIKGPRGCVWNGPAWPMANSLLVDAQATFAKTQAPRLAAGAFSSLLETTRLILHGSSFAAPSIVEHYNPETGAAISGEEDYFHSTFVDLVIRHVVGLTPQPGQALQLHPLPAGCDWFCLQDVVYAGHRLTITWLDPGVRADVPWPPGYNCWIDAELAMTMPRRQSCAVRLPG